MKKRYSRKRSKIFSLGVTRPFVNKRNRLMLGSGRKKKIKRQKGGFFAPIAAALAGPAIELVSSILKR